MMNEDGNFVDMREDYEDVQIIGTEWHRLVDYGQVLDSYMIIQTETEQRLILMQKEKFQTRDSGGIRFKPVLKREIPEYFGQ